LAALRRPISEIAGNLGVTQLLRRILAENAPIMPAMALRLGTFCGNRPDLWLRMQQAYDLWHAQKALQKQLSQIPAAGEAA
jgi:antitoxin HigA-1